MAETVEVGGTSFDAMYINVNGESGFFETSLAAYGQEGEPCPRCGRGIRRIAFGNRSSHFCPKCQVKGVRLETEDGVPLNPGPLGRPLPK